MQRSAVILLVIGLVTLVGAGFLLKSPKIKEADWRPGVQFCLVFLMGISFVWVSEEMVSFSIPSCIEPLFCVQIDSLKFAKKAVKEALEEEIL